MKFRYTHAELVEHLNGLISLQIERIALVDQEIASMQKLRDESPVVAATKSGHANPNEMLEQRRDQYEQLHKRYTIMRDHLVPEDQDLAEDDLVTLGILKSRYYE